VEIEIIASPDIEYPVIMKSGVTFPLVKLFPIFVTFSETTFTLIVA
jgi:hypothetical protein